MTNRYLEYLKDNPKGYWFKRRLFGWGWVPVRWQGWLATAIYVAGILTLAFRLDDSATDSQAVKELLIPLAILTTAFIILCIKTGEKPRWQWGLPNSVDRDIRE